jgi:predicted  nucleic acid-binding Zn-ribbon protein
MAEIHNISNSLNTIFLEQPNAVQNTQRQINQIDVRINAEENKIVKNRQLSEITKEMIVVNRVLYNSNNEIIKLYQESKELGEKRIDLMEKIIALKQDTNDKLQALLDRNSSKIDISDVKLLDRQLDTLSKKDNVLKTQTATVDAKIEKLVVKVEFAEKQITKLEANSKNIETSNVQVKPDKNIFTTGYRPTADQIAKLEFSKIQQETHNLDTFNSLFQQRVFYSQKNIYESILNSLLLKVIV